MEKFFNKIARRSVGSSSASENSPLIQESVKESTQLPSSNEQPTSTNPSSSRRTPININALPSDLVDRKPISSHHPNDRDEVRRAYLQKVLTNPEIMHSLKLKCPVICGVLMNHGLRHILIG